MKNNKPEASCSDNKRDELPSRAYNIDVDDIVLRNRILYCEDGVTLNTWLVTISTVSM